MGAWPNQVESLKSATGDHGHGHMGTLGLYRMRGAARAPPMGSLVPTCICVGVSSGGGGLEESGYGWAIGSAVGFQGLGAVVPDYKQESFGLQHCICPACRWPAGICLGASVL